MKNRAARTVQVVDRHGARVARPRTSSAPGATPDRRIEATPATDLAREEARFKTLTREQQIVAAITAHVDHVRRQNSPEEIERLSETEFWRYVLDESLRNAQFIGEGSDPRIVLRSVNLRELRTAWLACRHLAPKTTAVVTAPKMPNKDPWWTFIKDLRVKRGLD